MPKGLTDKQIAFVDEYCKDWNATRAMLAVGYTKCYADKNSRLLVGNSGVKQAIDAKKAEIAAKIEVDFKWLTDQRLKAIQTAVEKKDLNALDRHLQALDKHKGYYEQDNAQKSVQQAIQVNIDTPEALEQGIERLKALKEDRQAIDAEYDDAEDAICRE